MIRACDFVWALVYLPSFLLSFPFFSSYVFKTVPCSPDWSQSFDIVKADLELRDLCVLSADIIDICHVTCFPQC